MTNEESVSPQNESKHSVREIFADQTMRLQNANDFIQLLMQQLEQARRERDIAQNERDLVVLKYSEHLKNFS